VNVISLCSGIGGLDLGVRLAVPDARTILYLEREAFAAAVLAYQMEQGALDEAPIWPDLESFDGRPFVGVVDLLIAGYPCQPFSVAGKRGGASDPRHLWPHVARIIHECEPAGVFLENVGGHLRLGFREVAEELRGMGYRVAAGLFTAAEVGAPHRRERLFVLGLADSKGGAAGESCAGNWWEGIGGGGSEDVAVREGGRSWRAGSRKAASECGEPVADGAGERLQGREPQRLGHELISLGGDGGGAVGDADQPRPQGRGVRLGEEPRERPPWPPGPSDREAWERVLAADPSLEPALRLLANEFPSRLDELRALGNAVVPLQAAFAFRTLAKELA
jgi:DNA (cytosine-5)-methyltransferase 1